MAGTAFWGRGHVLQPTGMTAQLSSICSIMTTSQLLSARSRMCCGKPCGFTYSWVVAGSHGVRPSGVTEEYCVHCAPQLGNAAFAAWVWAADVMRAEN